MGVMFALERPVVVQEFLELKIVFWKGNSGRSTADVLQFSNGHIRRATYYLL